MIRKKIQSRGFSLIELSALIIVISIFAIGTLSVFLGSSANSKIKTTNRRIEQVYRALQVYSATNKVLPCPAPITAIKSTDSTYGTASATSGCAASTGSGFYVSGSAVYGMVPVKTLGLPSQLAEDGFGNKFGYVVDKNFTISSTPGPFESSNGSIVIRTYASGALSTKEANAIFAIVSYGANQNGAFAANSATQIAASSDTDEIDNGTATFDSNLIYSTTRSTVFDDVVFYKNKNNTVSDASNNSLANANVSSSSKLASCAVNVAGVTTTSVNVGSGSLTCNAANYAGTVSYTCVRDQALSTTGSCSCATGYTGANCASCASGYISSGGLCKFQSCSGGTLDSSSVSGYAIHTFTASGTLVCSTSITQVNILVVGAGGTGGAHTSTNGAGMGGGGGGGVIYVTNSSLANDSYTITVAGTTAGKSTTGCAGVGNNGASSIFRNSGSSIVLTARGGGGGGGACTAAGQTGGSGGGGHAGGSGGSASGGTIVGLTGTVYANAGGSGFNGQPGGGGGGASQAGTVGTSGGNGGQGISINVSGTSVVYGSGGGGNGYGTITAGGTGGTNAGNGTSYNSSNRTGISGVANTGGGGGGENVSGVASGDGGSGIVIVRYYLN